MTLRLCPVGHLMSDAELETLCPECLMALVPPQLPPIGRFTCVRRLGVGGFGSVYHAHEGDPEKPVAIKVLRNGHFASDKELLAFRREVQILAKLSHARIVEIYEAGEHEGLPFFTMEYMGGGTLRDRMGQFQGSPARAVALMLEIAEAVELLHRDPENPARGPILHCDLKPGNILFDAVGNPKISDFGIAKVLGEQGRVSTTLQAGCPWYMAPEQAYAGSCTPAADVYSLGAILYELFTGEVPFDGTAPEVMAKLRDEFALPRAPRELVPRLDRYLETVVLNALEKNPARRYQSARAFAADLKRALLAKPPEELPAIPVRDRLRTGLRRYGALAGAVLWTTGFAAWGLDHELGARAREQQTIDRQLRDDAAMASVQAVAFQFQLREYRHRVARLAQQPEVVALLKSATVEHPSRTLIDRSQGFDSLFVLAPDGRMRARTTRRTEEYMRRSFEFRDYFRGARALAQTECPNGMPGTPLSDSKTAYLGRVHRSESEGEFEIAISAPVCDERGFIGILGATIASNKSFGSVVLEDGPAGHVTALLAPRGGDRKDIGRPPPDELTFVVHPALSPGKEYQLRSPAPAFIRARLGIRAASGGLRYVEPLAVREYEDPVAAEPGLWTAALAPVDESGFVVLVESPRAPDRSRVAFVAEKDFVIATGVFGVGLVTLLAMHLRRRLTIRWG